MSSNVPALRAMGLVKRFGSVMALGGVDFELVSGEIHALLGENGAGKSTLLKIIAGVQQADEGALELFGESFNPQHPLDAAQRGVATIHQELCLADDLSVEANIMLGRELRWGPFVDRGRRRELATHALSELGSTLDPRAMVSELGPGERQLVEIARALAFEARVLILDEPTSSLSAQDVERLFEVLRKLRAQGCAIVYVSHFLEEVEAIADRYSVLRDGCSVGTGSIADTSSEQLITLMLGRRLDEVYPAHERRAGEELLRVEALVADPLPEQASFVLRRGEILGLAGLVGAGRSEVLRVLFGLARAKQRRVVLHGVEDHGSGDPARSLARGMGLLSEDRKHEGLALELSIAKNITLSRLAPYAKWGILSPKRQAAAAKIWAERTQLRFRDLEQSVAELSGGNQQKVALARLLHHDVEVFLLDEPTRGVDVASKAELYRRFDELARAGKSLVVVGSYLPELLGICDRIAVMHRGRLSPAKPVAQWSEHSLLQAATRGTDENPGPDRPPQPGSASDTASVKSPA